MYLERNEDLSVYYFVKNSFSTYPAVNVVDGYPTTGLTIPTVSVEADTINIAPWELGNRHGIVIRIWYIDIFATNKSQRDEFAYKLIHELEDNIPVYDYNTGFPPLVIPPQIGTLKVEEISSRTVKVFPDLVDVLYYRSTVTFTATYDNL